MYFEGLAAITDLRRSRSGDAILRKIKAGTATAEAEADAAPPLARGLRAVFYAPTRLAPPDVFLRARAREVATGRNCFPIARPSPISR